MNEQAQPDVRLWGRSEAPRKTSAKRTRRNITFCCRVSSLGLYLKGSSHFIKCHIISPLSRRRSSDWDEEICQWTTFFSSSSLRCELLLIILDRSSLSHLFAVRWCRLNTAHLSTSLFLSMFLCFFRSFRKNFIFRFGFPFRAAAAVDSGSCLSSRYARERRSERDWISKASQNSGSSQFLSLLSGVHMWNFFITQIIGFSYIDLKISLRKLIVCLSLTHQNSLAWTCIWSRGRNRM